MGYENQLSSAEGKRLLVALRKVCARLAEAADHVHGFGHTTFRVGKHSFVIAGMGEDGTSISIKADRVNQGILIARGPYYRTPYIGQHGWVSVDRPLEQDWKEIEQLIGDAYQLAAPKRLTPSSGRSSTASETSRRRTRR